MATAIGSSAPTPAILLIGSEVSAMDKRSFQNETAFQVVMHLARRMHHHLEGVPGLRAGDDLSLSAFFRGLIHLIIVSNRVIYSVERS